MGTTNNSGFESQMDQTLREIKRAQTLKPIRNILLFLVYALLAVSIVIAAFRGLKNTPYSIPLIVIFLAGVIVLIDTHRAKIYERAGKIKARLDHNEEVLKKIAEIQKNAETTKGKIPLSVGFINLAGEHMDKMLLDDALEMSRLFRNIALARKEIPQCAILFVYANIEADGSLKNYNQKNVRQLAQESNSSIIILAAPNEAERIKKAASLDGPKIANIVFTIDRKNDAFIKFFKSLFQNMRDGKEMLSSWVALAPQGPQSSSSSAPVTLLFAEAGKLAFPVQG